MPKQPFPMALFAAREAAGLTQEQLAYQAGVSVRTIARIESLRHDGDDAEEDNLPELETVLQLARVLPNLTPYYPTVKE